MAYAYAIFFFIGILLRIVLYRWLRRRSSSSTPCLPLPPGPRKLPFIGNLLDMPKVNECETYRRWAEECNTDILHLDVMGTSIVILSSARAAEEIFDKGGAICSQRPRMPMLAELVGLDWAVGLAPYGEYHRQCRAILEKEMRPRAIKKYEGHQIKAVHSLLRRLVDSSETFLEDIRHMTSEIIMSVTYGIEVEPSNDPLVDVAEQVVAAMGEAGVPGAFLVDVFPILKYIPEWFPGSGFKKKARKWRELSLRMLSEPFSLVKKHKSEGTAGPCLTLSSLETVKGKRGESRDEQMVEASMASLYFATVDAVSIATRTFLLSMVLYPEVQAKAHAELDRVFGCGNLPASFQEEQLPYISAIVKECLRWYPLAPLAIPHLLTEDTVYKGYHVPSGSVVIGNTWAICRDPELYASPHVFDPSRFLPPNNAPDPIHAFGYGRRICPGRYMAHSTLLITFASILAAFDIKETLDAQGIPITPKKEFTSGLAMCPLPFKCNFRLRSENIANVLGH